MSFFKLFISAAILAALPAAAAIARDQVHIAGSSTVLPYASIVAEAFGENTLFPTPVVESGGSSGGLKRFCEGVGTHTIDVVNVSRKIKPKEVKKCTEAGVTEIIEVKIGYDGIVFASDIGGSGFSFTQTDWFLALSDAILVDGAMVANPNKTWSQVNAAFPAQTMAAYIPGTKHGTREVFEDKVILVGCKQTGAYDALLATGTGDKSKEKAAEQACIRLRTDGTAIDIDGDYTETLTSINTNKNGIGVFGLAFYENNTDKLQVAPMAGIMPSTESIANGTYPVSRPLYFYIKKAHIGVIPGLKEYVEFFVSEDVAGPDGPLAEYGLVSDPELDATRSVVSADKQMK